METQKLSKARALKMVGVIDMMGMLIQNELRGVQTPDRIKEAALVTLLTMRIMLTKAYKFNVNPFESIGMAESKTPHLTVAESAEGILEEQDDGLEENWESDQGL